MECEHNVIAIEDAGVEFDGVRAVVAVCHECGAASSATTDAGEARDDFDARHPTEDLDEPYDALLAQQELEDFAQDGEFENMPPGEEF